MNRLISRFLVPALIALALLGSGCSRQSTTAAESASTAEAGSAAGTASTAKLTRKTVASESGVSLQIVTEKIGRDSAELPSFTAESEDQETLTLGILNVKCRRLRSRFEDSIQDDGSSLDIACYPVDSAPYLQVTAVMTDTRDELTTHELQTICYDPDSDDEITAADALSMAGYTGVQLSQTMGELFPSLGIEGNLTSTDMQGFRLSRDGSVDAFYMCLTAQDADESEDREYFFSFDPQTRSLTPLSEDPEAGIPSLP